MTSRGRRTLSLFFSGLLLQACQATPPVVGPVEVSKEVSKSDRFGVVTLLSNEEAEVIPRTSPVPQTSFTGYQFGAIGGLIDGLISAGMHGNVIESSLGRPADDLTIKLDRAHVEAAFRYHFVAALRRNFTVDLLDEFSPLVAGQEGDITFLASKAAKRYKKVAKEKGLTTVIEVVYRHGLGVYSSQADPAPIIVADIVVIRVSDEKVLMKKTLLSDSYRRQGHSLRELTANNNKLYEREVTLACDSIGYLMAAEFGVSLDPKERSYWK